LKIYFEIQVELLDYRIKAMEQKVRRTKISTDLKGMYYKFLQNLEKVLRYGLDKHSPKRKKLIEGIKTSPGVIEREWLLEKLG
jgi:hypothetical protein